MSLISNLLAPDNIQPNTEIVGIFVCVGLIIVTLVVLLIVNCCLRTKQTNENTHNSNGIIKILLILVVIVGLIFGATIFADCSAQGREPTNTDGYSNPFCRSANKDDVKVELVAFVYALSPHKDIDDLEITIHIYNSSKVEIANTKVELGDVEKNIVYSGTLQLQDFRLINVSQAEFNNFIKDTANMKYGYTVTGGTTSWFN